MTNLHSPRHSSPLLATLFITLLATLHLTTLFILFLAILHPRRRQALLCVLATNCSEPMYAKLIEALCNEHNIDLIKIDDNKKLGEWVGLCRIDKEGKPRKVVGCGCVVVTDYGKETSAHGFIANYLKSQSS